ncbi:MULTISPECIES: hypothetical protein [unclassified Thermosipho (in: thermotogales)]|uniref:hypothetical protein n=1 Tax=unclassified Thermosipho (in: thermotogales) TaxID=2676525 RepID=UPI0009861EC8|nr:MULTISPECIES: hypothetical protein [unclassified Thermosipho (in: thermotogales)]MBT1247818.1 hypothetical protein [Thermosipho sp. 1244]OOC46036.1 hypothetical protein XO09_08520 [Thermosipho sp. 1223]
MEFLNKPVVNDKVYLSFCDGERGLCGDVKNCNGCANKEACVAICNEGCKKRHWWDWLFPWLYEENK